MIQTGSGQVLGLREEQQDALGFGTVVLADGRRAPLAVLADGMGGHHGGAIAARLAIETFLASCRASRERTFTGALEAALLAANQALAVRSHDDARLAQMGCTLIATAVEGGVLHYVSVGDSLLWRVAADRIERLNADHSMMPVVTAALARGTMSQAEAQAHGSILRSAVTGRLIELVDLRSVELARDEWVLLASDGILSLAEAEVHALTRPSRVSGQARVDALLDAVEQVGEPDQDNCTVVLLPMALAPPRPQRRPLATVLGTLAVLAGLAVVGAAGWELLRFDPPLRSGTGAAAIPSPAVPLTEVAPVEPQAPAVRNGRSESIAAQSGATDRQVSADKTRAKKGAKAPRSAPTESGAPSPTPSPTRTPTATPTKPASGEGIAAKPAETVVCLRPYAPAVREIGEIKLAA